MKKPSDYLLKSWVRCLAACLMFAGVGMGIHRLHAPKPVKSPANPVAQPIPSSLTSRIFPDAASTELIGEDPSGWTLVRDRTGTRLGLAVTTSPSMNWVIGYSGPTPVLLGFDLEQRITAVQLLKNTETASYLSHVVSSGYLDHWLGLSVEQARTAEFDAVSGATQTSRAIARSIRGRLTKLDTHRVQRPPADRFAFEPLNWQTVMILFTLLCGATLGLWPRALQKWRLLKPARYLVLVGSVVVLGFMTATMVSMSLLEGLAKSGRVPTNIAVIVLVALAVIVPPLFGRNVYCHYVCPFGGLQEIIFRVSPVKCIKPGKRWRVFKALRYAILIALVISVLAGWGLSPDMQEPFSAFHWLTAGPMPRILAAAALLVSLLGVNRPWCTYCCSSGALLDLLRRKRPSRRKQVPSNCKSKSTESES